MTTFQIIVTVLLVVIAILIGFLIRVFWVGINVLTKNQDVTFKKVDHIDTVLHGGFEQTGRGNGGYYIRSLTR